MIRVQVPYNSKNQPYEPRGSLLVSLAQQSTEGETPMRKLAILIGGAALLGACETTPPPPPPPPPVVAVDLNNPLMAPGFLAQAASGDQFEIQSSQLAMQASQNLAVRNFAN